MIGQHKIHFAGAIFRAQYRCRLIRSQIAQMSETRFLYSTTSKLLRGQPNPNPCFRRDRYLPAPSRFLFTPGLLALSAAPSSIATGTTTPRAYASLVLRRLGHKEGSRKHRVRGQ